MNPRTFLSAIFSVMLVSAAFSQDSRTVSRPGTATSLVQNVQIVGSSVPPNLSVTMTPTPNWVLTAIITPTVTATQTPCASTLYSGQTSATSSEAWKDLWACGGLDYSLVFSGTIASNGVAYAIYGANGPSAPSAGATNGVLISGPVTLSAGSYALLSPTFRYIAVRLQDFSGATTVTARDYSNNFNSRQ